MFNNKPIILEGYGAAKFRAEMSFIDEKKIAERYLKGNDWDKPLRYHNEETRNCDYLKEDGSHCKKKREHTTCYTCCFNCSFQ